MQYFTGELDPVGLAVRGEGGWGVLELRGPFIIISPSVELSWAT